MTRQPVALEVGAQLTIPVVELQILIIPVDPYRVFRVLRGVRGLFLAVDRTDFRTRRRFAEVVAEVGTLSDALRMIADRLERGT